MSILLLTLGLAPVGSQAAQQVIQISDTNDDASESNSTVTRTGNYIYVRSNTTASTKIHGGFRFPTVAIPQGTVITSATFSGYVYSTTYDDYSFYVYGNNVDNANNFLTEQDIDGRTRTSASVPKSQIGVGTGWKDIDVTAIVNEILQRTGWTSGNSIALLFIGNGGTSYYTGYYDFTGSATQAATLTITWPDVNLNNHKAGQEQDKFLATSFVTGAELFAFKLYNSDTGSSKTVTQIEFPLSSVSGITSDDFANLKIYIDTDEDGAIEEGEETTVGGDGVVDGGETKITFSTSFDIAAGATVNYILKGDVSSLVRGDAMTISLSSSNITLSSGTKGGTTTSVSHLYETAEEALIAYSEESGSTLKYSAYATDAWTAGATAYTHSGPLYWKVAKTSPDNTKQVVVWVDTSATLYASVYNGFTWSTSSLGTVSTYNYRCFDVAFEQVSGKLLVVAGSPTTKQINYWTYANGTWSSYDPYIFSNAGGVIRWAKLASHPTSNEIGLMVVDATSYALGLIWNGSAWNNTKEKRFTTSVESITTQAIAVEYMASGTNKGKAVFAWAETSWIRGWVWNGSDWDASYVSEGVISTPGTKRWLRLSPDPNSDALILGYCYSSTIADIYALRWTGTDWDTEVQIELSGGGNADYDRPFDVIFESGTVHVGHCIIVYSDNVGLKYRHSSDGGVNFASEATIVSSPTAYWVQLAREWNNTIHLAVHDSANYLNTWTWNNSAWTTENTISTALEQGDGTNREIEAFALTTMLVDSTAITVTLDDYVPGGQPADQFGTSTPVNDAHLHRFQLTNNHATDAAQVNTIVFNLSLGGSWVNGNFYNLRINDGTTDLATGPTVDVVAGTITFSDTTNGLFTISASTTVNYRLIGDVSGLAADDIVTISLVAAKITLKSGTVNGTMADNDATHTADGTLTLADHDIPPNPGQVPDAFGANPNTFVLYRFKLTQAGEVTVSSLHTHLIVGGGFYASYLDNGELWEDTNGNGTFDGAGVGKDTLLQDGVEPVFYFGSEYTMTFTPASAFKPDTEADSGTIYFIRVTVNTLFPGNNVTFKMTKDDITVSQTHVTKSNETGEPTDAYHVANGTLTLANHVNKGQVTDKFTESATTTDVLYRFRLSQEGSFSVEELRLRYTATGIDDNHITAALWADLDNDGEKDDEGTDHEIQNNVKGSGGPNGQLIFYNNFAPSAGTNYYVYVQVTSLVAGDSLTLHPLIESDIDTTVDPAYLEVIDENISSVTHIADGTLQLVNHTLGQKDQFEYSTSTPPNVGLFRFKLTRTGTLDVHQVTVHYTTTGGVAAGDVSSASLYYDDGDGECAGGDTLIKSVAGPHDGTITFTQPFDVSYPGGSLYVICATVSNLVAGDTTTFFMGTGDIVTHDNVPKSADPDPLTATHTADGSLVLADHNPSGQVGDRFLATSPVTDVLYRFRLTRTGNFSVTELRVNYTGDIEDGQVTSAELWRDADNDGAVDDPGDERIQYGINGSGGKLTFTTDFTPDTGGTNYLVRVTVSGLTTGDTATFSVGYADIDAGAAVESGSISPATHIADGSLTLANHNDKLQVGNNFGISNPATNVFYRFNLTGTNGVTITELRVNYTTGNGVEDPDDVKSGALYVDVNSDGAVDGGDTLIQSGINGSGNKLTFSGLSEVPNASGTNYLVQATVYNLVPGDTTTFSCGTGDIDSNATTEGGSISPAIHTALNTIDLAGYSGGQEEDKFTDANSVVGAELFRFQLTNNNTGASTIVNKIEFQLSSVTGMQAADFSTLQIYVDANGDGAIGETETTTVGGSGVVEESGDPLTPTKITFGLPLGTSFEIAASATVQYILKGTVINLAAKDTVTIGLGTSNITLSSGTVGGTPPSNATHTADGSLVLDEFQLPGNPESPATDALGASAEQTVIFFKFKLVSSTAPVTVNTLKVNFTTTGGIANDDMSAGELWADDGDGEFDSYQDTMIQGSVTPSGGIFTFDTDFIPASGTYGTNYFIRATVKNLIYLDSTTFSILASNVIPLQSITTTGSVASVTHTHDPGIVPQVVYSNYSSNEVFHIGYELNAWQPETTLVNAGQSTLWKIVKTSPENSEQVALWVNNAGALFVSFWDGTAWRDASGDVGAETLGNVETSSYRCFDAAYEQETGQLLIVAADPNDGNINWWTWNGTTLTKDGGGSSISVSNKAGAIHWIKLASNPKTDSNEIAIIAGDAGNRVFALIWSGTEGSIDDDIQELTDDTAANKLSSNTTEAVAVSYAHDSFYALFAYGKEGAFGGRDIGYTTWNGATYSPISPTGAQATVMPFRIYWLRLASDPDSDDMILGLQDKATDPSTNTYLKALRWIGTTASWDADADDIAYNYYKGSPATNRSFDLIFENDSADPKIHSGHAIFVYSSAGSLYYKHSANGGDSWGSETSISSSVQSWWIQLQRNQDNIIHLAAHEYHYIDGEAERNHLSMWTWDNSSWTQKTDLHIDLEYGSGHEIEAFCLAITHPANPEFGDQPPPPNLNYNFGAVNAKIVLKGENFGTVVGTVKFGTYTAEIEPGTWTATQVTARVPVILQTDPTQVDVTLTNSWGKFATSTQKFTIITEDPTFTALIPTYVSNFDTVDIWRITGTNLSPDCRLILRKSGQTDISAVTSSITLKDSGTIDHATFDLSPQSAAVGSWDLVIRNPDYTVGCVEGQFGCSIEKVIPEAITITTPAKVSEGNAASWDSTGYVNARNIVRDSTGNWYAVFRGSNSLYINKRTVTFDGDGNPVLGEWDPVPTKLVGITSDAVLYYNPSGMGLCHGGVSVDIRRASTWPDNSNDVLHIAWQAGIGSESKFIYYAKCTNLTEYKSRGSWSGSYASWVEMRDYVKSDMVTHDPDGPGPQPTNYYRCIKAHKSVEEGGDEPGVGWRWTTYWDLENKDYYLYDTIQSTGSHVSNETAAPDIVVDHDGYVHITYFIKESTDYQIKYRTNRTRWGHWDSIHSIAYQGEPKYQEAPLPTLYYDELYFGPSIDVDSHNYIHLAWSQVRRSTDNHYVIRYAKTEDWINFNMGDKIEIINGDQVDGDQDMGMPSLVVDRDDNIYVVTREYDAEITTPDNNDLYFAYFDGATWTETNVSKALRDLGQNRFGEYYLDLDVESPVVGTREKTTDHILMTKVLGGYHQGKVIYLKWNDTEKRWDYEKDPDTGTDSQYYVSLERRSPFFYTDMAYLFYDSSTDKLMSEGVNGLKGEPPTAVRLASFKAKGNGNQVLVEWVTKTEIDNLGFNLYKSTQKTGIYTKLNSKLIPGLLNSVSGRRYTYDDADVVKGQLYYYKLEDVDLKGKKTLHGPVCVDWDGDGIPDDVDPTPGQPDPVPPSPDPGPAPTPGPSDPGGGSDDGQGGKHSVTKVDLVELNAYQTQEGIVLKWRTGHEINNLGFHIYREENGESYRITPNMIMGSVWLTGKGTPLNGGRSYTWWDIAGLDTQSSSLGAVRYWLEDIDLSGKRTLHGPVEVVQPANEAQLIASKPSSEFAKKLDAKYEEFWKIQDLRERLRQAPLELGSSTERPTRTTRVSSSPRAPGANHAAPEHFTVTEPRKRQWSLAAKPAVKLLIKEEGWYRVTQPELVAAGLDPHCKSKYLQLFVDGVEQAMLVTGSRDGHFDPSDAIEFYATGLDTQFTDTRVYWLVDTSYPGRRVRAVNDPGVPASSTSYLHTVERKDRIYYIADLLNGEESNFFGLEIWNVSGPQTDQILTLPHTDTDVTPNAILEVTLQGYTYVPTVPHVVNVWVNENHWVGEVTFDGQSKVTASFEIPQDWLQEGDNLVTFVPPDDELDATLIVSVKLSYWHTFTADDDALKLTATGGEEVSITGFTGSNIRVVDITDPKDPCEAIGTVEAQGGGYSVTFNVPGTGVRTLLAFTDQKVKAPSEIVANQPTEWNKRQDGYSYVMIVHGDVANDVNLHSLRRSKERQGFTVARVDVEDIYDEFSFGAKDTRALRDFLERATNQWVKKPQYVLLVGDASFDPRDFLEEGQIEGQIDFVPTKIVEATFLETASDDWFVDFDDDGLPNIPIGRLPARTPEELSTMVSKIATYESSKEKMSGALLVAGKKLYGAADYDFETAVQEIGTMLEGRMTVNEILQDQIGDGAAREALWAGVHQGPSIVNFVGHGSNEIWGELWDYHDGISFSLFSSDDAPTLTNGSKLPFFINMTCLNGFFHDLYTESLAEALMRAEEGGAVAVWTSSGLTYPDQQHLINQELIRQLLSSEKITIGQAAASAKAATGDQDVRRTWILFGDPATRLKY